MTRITTILVVAFAGLVAAACGSDSKVETAPVAQAIKPAPEPEVAPAPTYIPGKWVWFELNTNDVEKAKSFYSQTIGWQLTEKTMGEMTYVAIVNDGEDIGMVQKTPFNEGKAAKEQIGPHWLGYISVVDVDASVATATTGGSSVLMPAANVPGVGRYSVMRDGNGAIFGVVKSESGDMPDKHESMTKIGNIGWMHYFTADAAGSVQTAKHYSDIAGYEIKEEQYGGQAVHVTTASNIPRGGIGFLRQKNLQGKWIAYVTVTDVDEMAAKVKAAGGSILSKPTDLDKVGRLAIVADPQGAAFGLWAGSEAAKMEAEPVQD